MSPGGKRMRAACLRRRPRIDTKFRSRWIFQAQKSGGMIPPHPPSFGHTRKRVWPSAQRCRRLAEGRRRSATRSREAARGCGGYVPHPSRVSFRTQIRMKAWRKTGHGKAQSPPWPVLYRFGPERIQAGKKLIAPGVPRMRSRTGCDTSRSIPPSGSLFHAISRRSNRPRRSSCRCRTGWSARICCRPGVSDRTTGRSTGMSRHCA